MARRKLMQGRVQLWGHQVAVDWAEPELEVPEEVMAQVRNSRVQAHHICIAVVSRCAELLQLVITQF